MDIADKDEACSAALSLARKHMPTAIFNHCIRTYLYASQMTIPTPRLFIACLLHDFGATDCCPGNERFEVEGADKAIELMKQQNQAKFTADDQFQVWCAIAIHASPGIAERITPMANVLRLAVLRDFHLRDSTDIEMEKEYPRLEIEKVLSEAVVERSKAHPDKSAPNGSWQGGLYRAHMAEPDYEGVNKAF